MTTPVAQPRDAGKRFDFRRFTDPAIGFEFAAFAEWIGEAASAGGYFCAYQNNGHIVIEQLNPISYKDYGFLGPEDVRAAAFSKEEGAQLIAEETEHLTEETREALLDYAELGYEKINPWLRAGSPGAPDLEQQRDILDEALERRGSLQRILYRREGKTAADVAHLTLGSEFVFPGYTSTSYDANNSVEDEDIELDAVVLEMKTSAGVNISNIARFEETEFVLPRDLRFRVVGIHRDVEYQTQKTQAPYDRGQSPVGTVSKYRKHTIVQLVEVDVDGRIIG